MIRRFLQIVGAIALLLIVLTVAAMMQTEWQARAAARAGRAELAAAMQGQPAAATPAPGAAPVLILLHGAGLNQRMWDPVRRHLDPAYLVIALDLPGHGANRAGVYSLDGAAAAVVRAAQSVAPAPVILVGDSLGGFTAMAAAARVPRAQLAGLVLAGSTGEVHRAGVARMVAQSLLVRGLLMFADDDLLADRMARRFGVSAEDAPNMVRAGLNFGAVGTAGRSLMDVDFRAMLAAVDAPVLIVNGSLDSNAVDHEPAFIAAARHATSLRFENCEHGVSLRRPAEFAAAISAFAARIQRQPR